MKIAVEGNIIDTEDIYKITDIQPVPLPVGRGSCSKYTSIATYYQFEIKFFNHKEYVIVSDIPLEAGKPKLIELRNKIISFCSDNQITIPHLKLNPDNINS